MSTYNCDCARQNRACVPWGILFDMYFEDLLLALSCSTRILANILTFDDMFLNMKELRRHDGDLSNSGKSDSQYYNRRFTSSIITRTYILIKGFRRIIRRSAKQAQR